VDEKTYLKMIKAAAKYIMEKLPEKPEWLIVLGSGLGTLADQLENKTLIPYSAIPGFPLSTVIGHAGQLVHGRLSGKSVLTMQGRLHYYEGHNMADIVFPVRVMQEIGIKKLFLTNAAGGIGDNYVPGDLMLITDHIGLWAESPLRGSNLECYGPRFIDQSEVYSKDFRKTALECASDLNITLHEGVYAYCRGPQFETPAEIRLLKMLGATAVGMSTVPEAVAATHGGMKVIAISCVTNLAAGLSDTPLSHEEVISTGAAAASNTAALIKNIILKT
jgi:purine-nucleoside phosphorylase